MSDLTKTLGYGGALVLVYGVSEQQLLLTSGDYSLGVTPSYQVPVSIPPTDIGEISRSRVLHADGVQVATMSVSFDVTAAALNLFATSGGLFQRAWRPTAGTGFTLQIWDGEDGWGLTDCYVTSISLTGQPGGLIGCSLGVMSRTTLVAAPGMTHAYILDTDTPYGYWWSGDADNNNDIREWTLTWNQEVTPVYSNESSGATPQNPRYLRVGMISASLEVSTYEQVRAYEALIVATQTFTLTGVTSASGYRFGGQNDLGMYTHTFETAASATVGSDDPVLAIA